MGVAILILNGNKYKTVLLDTNILREFTPDDYGQPKEIFIKFLNRYLSNNTHIIFISYYSFVEMFPYKDIFNRFINYFNNIPFFLVFPEKYIIEEEFKCFQQRMFLDLSENNNILYAISPLGNTLQNFYETTVLELANTHKEMLEKLKNAHAKWEQQRKYTSVVTEKLYYKNNEHDTIKRVLSGYVKNEYNKLDLNYFSGLRLMQYSQYMKVHFTKKPVTMNDVIDIKICCIVPYVDLVITENQQANFFKQSQNIIPQMKNVEILTLKDLKNND